MSLSVDFLFFFLLWRLCFFLGFVVNVDSSVAIALASKEASCSCSSSSLPEEEDEEAIATGIDSITG